MKKKGFTLIEMLGVITVLAILSVIVVPMVINQVRSKKDKIKSSIISTINAAAVLYIDQNKDEFNGQVNSCVKISSLVNKSLLDDTIYSYDEFGFDLKESYIFTKSYDREASLGLSCTPVYKKYDDATIIYFNPEINNMCSNPVSSSGVKKGCMKWYIFGDDENSSTVKMLLDHNTTPVVDYNTSINTALSNDISSWNLDVRNTARLITADEIAGITGAKEALKWDSSKPYSSGVPTIGTNISRFYFDGAYGTNATWRSMVAKTKGGSRFAWLYDYTMCLDSTLYTGCNIIDSNYYEYEDLENVYIQGYWTGTPVTGETGKVWKVDMYGSLLAADGSEGFKNGVRPVINVSKSIIK